MDHKERCKQLKAMRKEMADKLGVDLQQTECQYKGECSGTCPKCQQEERKLNKALLGGVLVATGMMLTACGVDNEVIGGATEPYEEPAHESSSRRSSDGSSGVLSSMWQDFANKDAGVDDVIAGDVEYDPAMTAGVAEPIDYEGGLEVIDDDEDDDAKGQMIPEDDIVYVCQEYSGAQKCEIDYYDGDVAMVICYEEITDKNGETSQNMIDYISVDIYSGDALSMTGEEFNVLTGV